MTASELQQITDRELDTWVDLFVDEGITDADIMAEELKFIDRGLVVLRSKMLLNRKSPKVKQQLEALIHMKANPGTKCHWDGRHNRYVFT